MVEGLEPAELPPLVSRVAQSLAGLAAPRPAPMESSRLVPAASNSVRTTLRLRQKSALRIPARKPIWA